MNPLFVDTSAFAALADQDDDNHASAITFNKHMKGRILVSTNYILDELYTLLLLHAGYPKIISFKTDLDILIAKRLLRIVWISDAISQASWQVFEQFNTDKEWSFTDCTSYVVMKQNRLTEVFTYDRHFTQMGFTRLPL